MFPSNLVCIRARDSYYDTYVSLLRPVGTRTELNYDLILWIILSCITKKNVPD